MKFIGLDLGTSGLKAVVIDAEQQIRAEAHAPLQVARPAAGWSEQDPAAWIAAVGQVMEALAAQVALRDVAGIGLAGHMHGAVFLDAQDQPLYPCILWNDSRAHAEAAALDADPQFRAVTGNIVFAGFTAPKVLWLEKHRPDLREKLRKVLLPKDYLRLVLTGDHVGEMSDAAGTAWLDTGARDWDAGLLAATGLDRSAMPRLVEGNAVSGYLLGHWAARWGLPKDVVVAGGAGDNAAAAIGVGVVRPGEAFISLGTSGVLFAASAGYRPAPQTALHSFCHALPKTWHQMGVILAAGDALNWWARAAGRPAAVLTEALGPLQAPGEALFLPYLGGERTPHNDPFARGAMLGLTHDADEAALTRAVIEGTAHAFRDSLDALAATGTTISKLTAVGGGSRSRYWLAALATALDLPVAVPVAGDFGAAFGAARLGQMAALGAGAELATPPAMAATVDPDPALTSAFAAAHHRYQAAYFALKGL